MSLEEPEIMTPDEVLEMLRVKRSTLYELLDLGLPYHSISAKGNTKRFYRSEVRAWLDSRGASRAPNAAVETAPRKRGRPTKAAAATPTQYKWVK